MGRTVVEGESPYKLAPGVHGEDEAEESDSDGDEAFGDSVSCHEGPAEEAGRRYGAVL
jgi:hypothetical protein